MLPDPALDLLRRVPPRVALAPIAGDDTVSAVVTTLCSGSTSYLAIQGPPGTGKTYVGSNVVARLVREHGWRVGVVGQFPRDERELPVVGGPRRWFPPTAW